MVEHTTLTQPAVTRSRPSRSMGDETGVALILAVLITAVLTIAAVGAISVVTSTQIASTRDRQAVSALSAAEAGLDLGASQVVQTESGAAQADGTTLTGAKTVNGSSVSWSAVKAADGSNWTVTATAVSLDNGVTRVVQERLQPTSSTTPQPVSSVYDYGFVMSDPNADCTTGSGGDTIGQSSQITAPVWIASSLCVSGGSAPVVANPGSASTNTLYVGGEFQTAGNATPIGSPSSPLASATIVHGCFLTFKKTLYNENCGTQGNPLNGPNPPNTTGGSGVYAASYSSTPQTLPVPTIDPDYWYANAEPGPEHACSSGSTPGPLKFDTDGTRNDSLGTFDLLDLAGASSASSFDCKFYSGGKLVGQLTYVYGDPASLVVNGTVFFDGNLDIGGQGGTEDVIYSGTGTIYVDGTVTFEAGTRFCAAPMSGTTCSGAWNPAQNALEIVAVNQNDASTAWSMVGDAEFEGIAFVNGVYLSSNSAWVSGPVIADSGTLSGDADFKAVPNPPNGGPGAGSPTTTTTWAVAPGTWRQCPEGTGCT